MLIRELVRADSAPPFSYMQGVAVPVTMTVEPRLITILEANRIDDQRIAQHSTSVLVDCPGKCALPTIGDSGLINGLALTHCAVVGSD